MKDPLTGPALGGVQERWAGREKLLYQWVRNSQGVIASGDKYAVDLYNKYNKSLMNPFPNLKDADIDNILAFVDDTYKNAGKSTAATAGTGITAAKKSSGPGFVLWMVLGGLILLTIFLVRILNKLNYLSAVQDGATQTEMPSTTRALSGKGIVGLATFAIVFLGGFTTIKNAINFGRQQNYAPTQPIKFSHATHAGVNKIDCQFCHDGARRSKHAVIPATNTCMKCHAAIKKGSKFGTAELTKIYASIGYDPTAGKYIDGYDKMSEKEIANIYKKWIGDNYMAESGTTSLSQGGQVIVDNQWNEIKAALTSKSDDHVAGPIEWVRIHNLPDHVYFNHSQHVTVGKIACQDCHGKIENMDIVHQYSNLSMGWCVNCHRKTAVNFNDNMFYSDYVKFHNEMKDGKREKVTVEDIGGTECQKCHY